MQSFKAIFSAAAILGMLFVQASATAIETRQGVDCETGDFLNFKGSSDSLLTPL
jgi:hypothetical protein